MKFYSGQRVSVFILVAGIILVFGALRCTSGSSGSAAPALNPDLAAAIEQKTKELELRLALKQEATAMLVVLEDISEFDKETQDTFFSTTADAINRAENCREAIKLKAGVDANAATLDSFLEDLIFNTPEKRELYRRYNVHFSGRVIEPLMPDANACDFKEPK